MKLYPKTAARRLHAKFGTWRKLAEEINFGTGAYWCGVSKGEPCSAEAREALKSYLGIKDKRDPIISARVPGWMIYDLDRLPGTRTDHVRRALQKYLKENGKLL